MKQLNTILFIRQDCILNKIRGVILSSEPGYVWRCTSYCFNIKEKSMTTNENQPDATVRRMLERLDKIERSLVGLGNATELCKRIENLESSQFTTKDVLTFDDACKYLGVSDSLLYKLTAARAVPHYKPRGKMIYFKKLELNEWLMHNQVITVEQAKLEAAYYASILPTPKKKKYGKRTKQ